MLDRRDVPLLHGLLLITLALVLVTASVPELHGAAPVVVAGYGPERGLLRKLARAFEKAHPGSVIDIRWNRNLKAVDIVKEGKADLAVTGEEVPELTATPIAWDGIAVIINFANPVRELTRTQVAQIFSGDVTQWSELGGADAAIEVVRRPDDRNLTEGLLTTLGLDGQWPKSARVVRSDQRVLSTVGGRLAAISYLSLSAALEAFKYGVPIRTVLIDGVDAGEPTVLNGRYPLRRPILLLSRKEPSVQTQAFIAFAQSAKGQRIVDEFYMPYRP